jgi:hypothetical protein
MITVKQAVTAALGYLGEFSDVIPARDLRLEETDIDDSGDTWLITFSYLDNPIIGTRVNKVFAVDAKTGDVKSMRTRSLLGSSSNPRIA